MSSLGLVLAGETNVSVSGGQLSISVSSWSRALTFPVHFCLVQQLLSGLSRVYLACHRQWPPLFPITSQQDVSSSVYTTP